jgi:hypothetical protein
MTREEAQEILLLQREGRLVENDAEVAEALRMAASDAELGQWLEQQREFNARVAQEFQSIEAPADLKARILAGAAGDRLKAGQHARWRASRVAIWAAAAAVILLVAGVDIWISRNHEDAPTFANFESRMTSFALRTYQMDIVTNNAAAVRDYLAKNGAPADFPLTPGLEKLPVKGGGRLSWQNQPVAMMCFTLTNNQTAFMFVVDQNAVEKPVTAAQVKSKRSVSSVTWSKEGKIYLLAASEKAETLAALAGL